MDKTILIKYENLFDFAIPVYEKHFVNEKKQLSAILNFIKAVQKQAATYSLINVNKYLPSSNYLWLSIDRILSITIVDGIVEIKPKEIDLITEDKPKKKPTTKKVVKEGN